MPCLVLAVTVNLQWFIWPLLALVGSVGLVALLSPDRFSKLSEEGSKWVDTNKLVALLDKPIDVDRHVLRYSRVFGAAVLAATALIAYLCSVNLLGVCLSF
jgi:hypothetical protein